MFTKHRHQSMDPYQTPEILRVPVMMLLSNYIATPTLSAPLSFNYIVIA